MNRRMTLFALFAALLLTLAGSASAAPKVTITILAPAMKAAVATTEVQFTWAMTPGADKLKFVLTSADGAQRIALNNRPVATNCSGGLCGVMINPMYFMDWEWREGMTYKWKVVAMKDNGKVLGIAKSKFVADMLRELTTIAPVNHAPPVTDWVIFSWQKFPYVGSYRIVVTKPNGEKIRTPWMNASSTCDPSGDMCGDMLSFFGQAHGKYKWVLEGKRNDVIGKTVSPTQVFYIGLPL